MTEHRRIVTPDRRRRQDTERNGLHARPRVALLTETEAETIYRYRYDESTGELSDRRVFAESTCPGKPDGLTVDSEGTVWSAQWDGSLIVRYDEEGEELSRYEVPARKVTSVAFGGSDLDERYVTTAGGEDRSNQGEYAGALLRCDPGITGVEEFRSEVVLCWGTPDRSLHHMIRFTRRRVPLSLH